MAAPVCAVPISAGPDDGECIAGGGGGQGQWLGEPPPEVLGTTPPTCEEPLEAWLRTGGGAWADNHESDDTAGTEDAEQCMHATSEGLEVPDDSGVRGGVSAADVAELDAETQKPIDDGRTSRREFADRWHLSGRSRARLEELPEIVWRTVAHEFFPNTHSWGVDADFRNFARSRMRRRGRERNDVSPCQRWVSELSVVFSELRR